MELHNAWTSSHRIPIKAIGAGAVIADAGPRAGDGDLHAVRAGETTSLCGKTMSFTPGTPYPNAGRVCLECARLAEGNV